MVTDAGANAYAATPMLTGLAIPARAPVRRVLILQSAGVLALIDRLATSVWTIFNCARLVNQYALTGL
jgi:hypothetical protein